ncbi:MAG: pyruvate kinase, partial [Chloroflexi bacterium]|nr:pyruvate kinase [Chloroflexota bacterium]
HGTTDQEVIGEVVHGGELRSHQGINLPGVAISAPSVTEKDLDDLRFGLAHGVDYVAISFVRRAEDVLRVKEAIAAQGCDAPVIAKLEKPEAIAALEEILDAADGVMVARGDMGVEMAPERVPIVQKRIIREANRRAIPVITATQMLNSMIESPRPTRAEVSDVANAILDGSDAVMLSGETAIGAYPIQAVQMMARICEATEPTCRRDREGVLPSLFAEAETIPMAMAAAVRAIVETLPIAAICVLTKTGNSARYVSHYRPAVPIYAFTPFEGTYRRLSLLWGVMPAMAALADEEGSYYRQVQTLLLERGLARLGDTVVLTGGHPIVQGGPTNLVKVFVLRPGHPTMVS